MNKSYKLFLSPHFDDIIFSLGNYLLNIEGNIIISTIFTKEENPHKFKGDYFKYANMKKRKQEDNSAIKILKKLNKKINVTVLYLDLPDNLFRSYYNNIDNQLENKLNNINFLYKIKEVFCPIGIGDHPDHLLTYNNCIKVFNSNIIKFYYEFPYSNLKLNLVKRLNYLKIKNSIQIKFKDLIAYYNHPIYNSSPRIIRIIRIIYYYYYYIFSNNYLNTKINKININHKNKKNLILSYYSQISPIFGSFSNLFNELIYNPFEYYLNIQI